MVIVNEPATGACCLLEGTCMDVEAADCDAQAGAYQGDGSTCAAMTCPCPGDTDASGGVDVDDLVNVIVDWGTDGSANGGDVDGSGLVDVNDLVNVIQSWGPCA